MTETTVPAIERAWEIYKRQVGSAEYLSAIRILEVDRHGPVHRDAGRWLRTNGSTFQPQTNSWVPDLTLSWAGWVSDVDSHGRGWSSTQWRLFDVVAGLTTGRAFNLVGVLDELGSWEAEVWAALLAWGTGGDGRHRPGRSTAVRRVP